MARTPRGYPAEVERSMEVLLALWDELRAQPGPFHLRMFGSSMWPVAPEGSLLAVTPLESRMLLVGDLVTFRLLDRIITHRVRRVARDGTVLAWGDAVAMPDPPLAPNDVLGRAVVVQRASPWRGARTAKIAALRALAAWKRTRPPHA